MQFNQTLKERAELRIRTESKQRKEKGEDDALNDLYAWWMPLKKVYPSITLDQKQRMVELIQRWIPVEEAVAAVLGIE
ncbi:hypothetical protein CSQ96_15910 [Janthinobacterium sp. BJB412]|nr:hypothetical protein CSQ96_15910 [Janthinobacterium sp. BJB412]